MRPRRVMQRIARADGHLELARAHHLPQPRDPRLALLGARIIIEQGRARVVQRPLGREHAQADPRHRGRGVAVADDQPAPPGRIEARLPRVEPDAVEGDPHALAAGQFTNALGGVFLRVHHDVVGPVRPRQRGLVLARHRPDHPRADCLEPLHQQQSDPARSGVDKHVHPRLDLRAALDEELRGTALQQHRRGSLGIDSLGDPKQRFLAHDPRGRIGAPRGSESRHSVALAKCAPRASRDNPPRGLEPESIRQRPRIDPAPVIGVDVVEPDRVIGHHHLARRGGGDIDLFPFDHFGTAI